MAGNTYRTNFTMGYDPSASETYYIKDLTQNALKNVVWVAKNGTDSGTGNISNPFLTITAALAYVAPIALALNPRWDAQTQSLPAGVRPQYFCVWVMPGTYLDSVTVPPFVALSGQSAETTTILFVVNASGLAPNTEISTVALGPYNVVTSISILMEVTTLYGEILRTCRFNALTFSDGSVASSSVKHCRINAVGNKNLGPDPVEYNF